MRRLFDSGESMFYQKYVFGDTAVYYAEVPVEGHEDKTVVGFTAYPVGVEVDVTRLALDSLVQVAFTGDENLIDYTMGLTMRNRTGTLLSVDSQTANKEGVVTVLSDGKGNQFTHTLRYFAETNVFTVDVTYCNLTQKVRTLELMESLSLSGISSMKEGISTCGLTLHRMTAAWSRECRLKSESFSHLGLDMSWARYGVKCEKWGQRGSMPVRDYFPFAAIEAENGVIWGAMLEVPFSWQFEVYQEKETCSLSGGLADFEWGHWKKDVAPQGRFSTYRAYFTVANGGGVNGVCNRFLHFMDGNLTVPASEEEMPVLFNEYCTTWGCPSEENIQHILHAIKPLGLKYFMIDAGWYKPDDKGWCNAPGDWQQSKTLFPAGIRRVVDAIHAEGMKAGVWFEFEVAGRDSDCFYKQDLLLTRDGRTITSKNRRFLDLRKEEVKEYLTERMIDFLRENGFDYVKIDYNDTIGLGCDGAESLGEGGRQVMEESLLWLDRLKTAIPDLVIENCSSGGSRIEPLRMSKVSMCSFSDAHECAEIPLVAANVSRVVPARQSQIWAVIREQDSLSRIIYSLCAGMLGRICLSGDVLRLPREKIDCICNGLNFYNDVKTIVRYGDIRTVDCDVAYYREPKGRQIYAKSYGDKLLVLVHILEGVSEVNYPVGGYRLESVYTDLEYAVEGGVLTLSNVRDYTAGAFLFIKEKNV